ncbi:hypothetical protein AAFC00_003356 [Neodothiora populina]|uniref:Zn(2)-C6 fungal-type domain-containing protein n=1 Tax=Neodothiora populina TaxID=2781224 RepID=A0ABR3PAD5_9PEZI
MSTSHGSNPPAEKPRRVLACVQCQQRKIKCDRNFPCSNCIKYRVQCTPAASLGPRQRRRRLPERELLDRLRYYESLLQQNHIKFEPSLEHNTSPQIPSHDGYSKIHTPGSDVRGLAVDSERLHPEREDEDKVKEYWHVMKGKFPDFDGNIDDTSPEVVHDAVRKTWDRSYQDKDWLLFGQHDETIDVSTMHPEQIQILKLWQIYIDNVNPLLKVTHTPTLQSRIIDAASDLKSTRSPLVALLFSIYCVAVMSLNEEDCLDMFSASKAQIAKKYRLGCQQALMKSNFLRSNDRECLVAFYLYLISLQSCVDPASLSAMLSPALRIAQRMGLHSESANSKCSPFEAEMRRRLWWSIVVFDARNCEMANVKSMMLVPTWNCKIPLNVNDFDLQPGMRDLPMAQDHSTEALFVVTRSKICDWIRYSAFHLDFVNPILKVYVKDTQSSSESEVHDSIEEVIESRYFQSCSTESPLQAVSIWMSRGQLAKARLLETYTKSSTSWALQPELQRDMGMSYALKTVECDTNLMSCRLTMGYRWFTRYHFPFPGYLHIIQELKARPAGVNAQRCWDTISDNYETRCSTYGQDDGPFFEIFVKLILQAWAACEALDSQKTTPVQIPRIVVAIKEKLALSSHIQQGVGLREPKVGISQSVGDMLSSMPGAIGSNGHLHDMQGRLFEGSGINGLDYMSWNIMDWSSIYTSDY